MSDPNDPIAGPGGGKQTLQRPTRTLRLVQGGYDPHCSFADFMRRNRDRTEAAKLRSAFRLLVAGESKRD
jgi:hypothetical protein